MRGWARAVTQEGGRSDATREPWALSSSVLRRRRKWERTGPTPSSIACGAEILLDQGGGPPEEAENLLLRALEIARQQETKRFELRTATSLARLWRDQGRRHEARALLHPVYAWFTEGYVTVDLKNAKALLEEL